MTSQDYKMASEWLQMTHDGALDQTTRTEDAARTVRRTSFGVRGEISTYFPLSKTRMLTYIYMTGVASGVQMLPSSPVQLSESERSLYQQWTSCSSAFLEANMFWKS